MKTKIMIHAEVSMDGESWIRILSRRIRVGEILRAGDEVALYRYVRFSVQRLPLRTKKKAKTE